MPPDASIARFEEKTIWLSDDLFWFDNFSDSCLFIGQLFI
jgi:hypothetical protein